jgi:lysophospholipase L1-like esterase
MENISVGSTKLDNMDTYKVALPASLASKDLDSCTTFCTDNSRPITFPGFSKDTCRELLSNLLNHVFETFRACPSPENLLARATDTKSNPHSETIVQRVVLCGASNLKYSAACFTDSSFSYVDNTVPGWMPTPENIATLVERVRALSADKNSAFIFDLLGNSSVRYEQYDGSTSLPFKSQGKFHLGGDVVVCPLELFKKTIAGILPILKEIGDAPSVIVPPIPRYLFARCCTDAGHCTNASNADYAETLLAGFLRLRNELIRSLVAAGIKNFKVLDSCCTTACANTANTKNRLTHLKSVTAKDGVHYVAAGYQHMAARSLSCLRTLLADSMCHSKPTAHFWRGFKSIRGSQRAPAPRHSRERGRGGSLSRRARGYHPYFRN